MYYTLEMLEQTAVCIKEKHHPAKQNAPQQNYQIVSTFTNK